LTTENKLLRPETGGNGDNLRNSRQLPWSNPKSGNWSDPNPGTKPLNIKLPANLYVCTNKEQQSRRLESPMGSHLDKGHFSLKSLYFLFQNHPWGRAWT
jgi:hypothetical protein